MKLFIILVLLSYLHPAYTQNAEPYTNKPDKTYYQPNVSHPNSHPSEYIVSSNIKMDHYLSIPLECYQGEHLNFIKSINSCLVPKETISIIGATNEGLLLKNTNGKTDDSSPSLCLFQPGYLEESYQKEHPCSFNTTAIEREGKIVESEYKYYDIIYNSSKDPETTFKETINDEKNKVVILAEAHTEDYRTSLIIDNADLLKQKNYTLAIEADADCVLPEMIKDNNGFYRDTKSYLGVKKDKAILADFFTAFNNKKLPDPKGTINSIFECIVGYEWLSALYNKSLFVFPMENRQAIINACQTGDESSCKKTRDRTMYEHIKEKIKDGKKVIAMVGLSHVSKKEFKAFAKDAEVSLFFGVTQQPLSYREPLSLGKRLKSDPEIKDNLTILGNFSSSNDRLLNNIFAVEQHRRYTPADRIGASYTCKEDVFKKYNIQSDPLNQSTKTPIRNFFCGNLNDYYLDGVIITVYKKEPKVRQM